MVRAIDEAKGELDAIASKLQGDIMTWEQRTGLKLVCIEISRTDTTPHHQEQRSSIPSLRCTAEIEVEGRS